MPYIETKTGGCLIGPENTAELARTASPFTYSSIPSSMVPDEIKRASWMPVENQGNQGSCQGNALSTGLEALLMERGGPHVQLSRMCAYRMSQIIDNISGDRGSTIAAGCNLAMGDGICTELIWPYPARYSTTIPREYEAATRFRCGGHSKVATYDDCVKALMRGPIHIGIGWGGAVDRLVDVGNGVIDSWPGGPGGHSVEVLGYRRTDYNHQPLPGDDPYIEIINSWSPKWGYQGRFLVSPRGTQQMIDSRWAEFQSLHGWESPPIEFQDGSYDY